MDRLVRRNVLAMSGRAVEAAGDVDVLLLDKTGTITYGNRQAAELLPLDGREPARLAERRSAGVPGRRDARGSQHRRPRRARRAAPGARARTGAELVEFSATTRMSGIDLPGRPRAGSARAPPPP